MRNKYTKELLEVAIAKSKSWSQVCRFLNVKPATGAQTHLKKRSIEFGIDTSHFLGQAWNKGRVFLATRVNTSSYLYNGSTIKSSSLRKKLIEDGIKEYKCERCGFSEWLGEPIPLELDHINSNHWDNRIENLLVLCPTCHMQLTIFRRRASMPSGEQLCLERSEAKAVGGSTPLSRTNQCNCGNLKHYKSKQCKACKGLNNRKVIRPSKDELDILIKTMPWIKIGVKYGVSDNAVRKWARGYKLI